MLAERVPRIFAHLRRLAISTARTHGTARVITSPTTSPARDVRLPSGLLSL